MDDSQQHGSSSAAHLACASAAESSSSSAAATLVGPSAHTAHIDQSASSSSAESQILAPHAQQLLMQQQQRQQWIATQQGAAASALQSNAEMMLAPSTPAAAAASSSPSWESDNRREIARMKTILAQGGVFRCFPMDNNEKNGPTGRYGLSEKLTRQHERGELNIDLFLAAIGIVADPDPRNLDWPMLMRAFKLLAGPVTNPNLKMLSAAEDLSTWDGSGRSTRELHALCLRLPSFKLTNVTQEAAKMHHFLHLPSAALALTWRAIEHSIDRDPQRKDTSLIELVNFFRSVRYASRAAPPTIRKKPKGTEKTPRQPRPPKTQIAEFKGRGIFRWLVHEIDSQLPRPDEHQPAYTLELCKLHLEQAGLKPVDGWPTGFHDSDDASFDFIDAVFVQLCEDEKKSHTTTQPVAAAAAAESSSSSVMLDVPPELNATLISPTQATSAPKVAKGTKRKDTATEADGDDPAAAGASPPSPVLKKPNAAVGRPPKLQESPPDSPLPTLDSPRPPSPDPTVSSLPKHLVFGSLPSWPPSEATLALRQQSHDPILVQNAAAIPLSPVTLPTNPPSPHLFPVDGPVTAAAAGLIPQHDASVNEDDRMHSAVHASLPAASAMHDDSSSASNLDFPHSHSSPFLASINLSCSSPRKLCPYDCVFPIHYEAECYELRCPLHFRPTPDELPAPPI